MPSTSSALVFGRAALLGITSGENSCNTAYPRCPRNEDDVLYYLNNHRGGFFKFFNGGSAFGDDNSQYNPNLSPYTQQQQQQQHPQSQPPHQVNYQQQTTVQYQQNQQQQQQQQTQSSLTAIQGLADLVNQGGGINLSNLGANAELLGNLAGLLTSGAGSQSPATNSIDLNTLASAGSTLISALGGSGNSQPSSPLGNVNDLVGNLLTGFIGSRFAGRRSKRSTAQADAPEVDDDLKMRLNKRTISKKTEHNLHEKFGHTKGKRHNIKFETFNDDAIKHGHNNESLLETDDQLDFDDEVEGRILNSKSHIYADDGPSNQQFNYQAHRDEKQLVFSNDQRRPSNSDHAALISFGTRNPKTLQFNADQSSGRPAVFFPPTSAPSGGRPTTNVKMVFPEGDRTGTGNLKFDDTAFQQPNTELLHRLGRILTGIRDQLAAQTTTEAPFVVQNYNRYPSSSSSSQSNANRYQQSSNYNSNNDNQYANNNNDNRYGSNSNRYSNPNYNNGNSNYGSSSFYQQQPSNSGASQYANNRGGIAPSNQNIYVTNAQGQTEYYIKPDGQKVRL